MPSLTIKDIPKQLYRRLKERAQAHRRSLNSEVIECLQRVLECVPRDPQELLARARGLRQGGASRRLTDRELAQKKGDGRP